MVFKQRDILDKLMALEQRLASIEAALAGLQDAESLRAALDRKQQQLDALAQQGLQVVQLLEEARRELARLREDKND